MERSAFTYEKDEEINPIIYIICLLLLLATIQFIELVNPNRHKYDKNCVQEKWENQKGFVFTIESVMNRQQRSNIHKNKDHNKCENPY